MFKLKKLILVVVFMLVFCTAYSQYDPPIGRTTHYFLRMWGEGDRPGADSVNRNLIDIDLYLHNLNTYITNVDGNVASTNIYLMQHFSAVNDSLSSHRFFMNALRSEFDNVTGIIGYLDDSATVFSNAIKQLKDTIYNRVPRLSLDNYFNGVNKFSHLTIEDNGSNASLQFNPAHLHNSLIKSGVDTVFIVVYNNGVMVPAVWNFKNIIKENDVQGHLIDGPGEKINTGLWVSETQNGTATKQLQAVPFVINGVTVYIISYTP